MRELHADIKNTAVSMIIKESNGFRLRMEKWQAISPRGLYAIDLIQESIDEDGQILNTSTYNFNMTQEELRFLAAGLLA